MTLGAGLSGGGGEWRHYLEELGDVAVADRNTFGSTGGTGGVHDVGDVVGVGGRWRGARISIDSGIVDVDDCQIGADSGGNE
ncbi:hypothetical protein LAUMK42_03090 [Mycobacterium persicum]|uniref:Uncharacterized protein n=1 Tax=Mycobacterium persicum TaxID=1487726 RepID=A0AB38UUU1_9MYCO|nr:hypothetical protein LAUMK42_03090 [Mycobacterium persicum]